MGWDMGRQTAPHAARVINKLSALHVQRLRKPGYHCDGGGLYIRVTESGSKSWLFRYTFAQRKRDMGLGAFPSVSLATARDAAHSCRQKLASGIDPIAARDADRRAAEIAAAGATSFKACAEAYIAAHDASWSNVKHRAQWRATLTRYVYPVIGLLSVKDIDTVLVMKILDPLWTEKPETASRVRGRIETILNWAKVRGYRAGENPAQWRGHLDQLLPARSKIRRTEHHGALPYREMPGLLSSLARRERTVSTAALEFLILTAARTGEVLGARWSEISFDDAVWIVPAERMKARRPHRVPLTAQAVALLKVVAEVRRDEFVFPGIKPGRPLSQMTLLMLLRRMGYGHVTVHGFRSSFRDWAAECSSHSREAAEMALAHTLSSSVEAAYLRSDLLPQRRKLMDDWSNHLSNAME